MPCPHASGGPDDEDGSLSRRQFVGAAVAIGGSSGLSACLATESEDPETPTPTDHSFPAGRMDLASLPERQHAWTEYLVRDRFGNTVLPQQQAMLMLESVGPVPPGEADRRRVEEAFRTLERAYQRGTGGDSSAVHHEGLLFAVGYSPTYFERLGGRPAGVDLPSSTALLSALDRTGPTADDYDAVIHLASGFGSILLAAERALFGDLDRVNGAPVEGGLDDLFEVAERRTGFVGRNQPARRYDVEAIPDSAPLSMGFKSSYTDTQPTEDRITIREGPFAGGTTMQVSRMETNLEDWYERDRPERTHRMFSPGHDPETVGSVGEDLASSSRMTEETAERADEDARSQGVVGHGQKLAHARDEDFRVKVMRRDFDAAAGPGVHFDFWQRELSDFVDVRRAMDGAHLDADLDDVDDGIRAFLETTNRATFLMPPRSLRALPRPDPEG